MQRRIHCCGAGVKRILRGTGPARAFGIGTPHVARIVRRPATAAAARFSVDTVRWCRQNCGLNRVLQFS